MDSRLLPPVIGFNILCGSKRVEALHARYIRDIRACFNILCGSKRVEARDPVVVHHDTIGFNILCGSKRVEAPIETDTPLTLATFQYPLRIEAG